MMRNSTFERWLLRYTHRVYPHILRWQDNPVLMVKESLIVRRNRQLGWKRHLFSWYILTVLAAAAFLLLFAEDTTLLHLTTMTTPLLVAFFLPIVIYYVQPAYLTSNTPTRIYIILRPWKQHCAILLDLWQCGVNGRQVLEALYVEAVTDFVRSTAYVAVTLYLIGLLFVSALLQFSNVVILLWAVTSAVLAILLARAVIHTSGETVRITGLQMVSNSWRHWHIMPGRNPTSESRLPQRLLWGIGFLVFGMGVPWLLIRAMPRSTGFQKPGEFFAYSVQSKGILALCISSMLAMPLILWITRLSRARHVERLQETLATAEEPFDLYVRKTHLNDPDWARRE